VDVAATPAPVPGVVTEDLNEELCLYRPDVDEVLVLNSSAADVWRLSDGASSVERISTLLGASYRRDVHSIRGDVETVIEELVSRGFLQWG
jgi:porphobilinogen deaminase